MQERLALAKKRSNEAVGSLVASKKKALGVTEAFAQAEDDEFIIDDVASSSSSSSSGSGDDSDDAKETIPRLRQIFVCSRKHSQLQQVRLDK